MRRSLAVRYFPVYPSEPLRNWRPRKTGKPPMTIGLALKYADGIVIGADSQLTYGTALKTNVGSKIAHCAPKSGGYSLVIVGAGHLDFLEKFYEQFVQSIDASDKTRGRARKLCSQVLRDLYLDHIFPYNTHKADDGGIEVLIAFRGTDRSLGLWRSQSTAILDAEEIDFIGSGGYSARFFAESLYRRDMSQEEAIIVATGILGRVKKFDPYCGGNSQIYALRDDGRISRQIKSITKIDKYLEDCEEKAAKLFTVYGSPSLSDTDAEQAIRLFAESIREFRRRLKTPLTQSLRDIFREFRNR